MQDTGLMIGLCALAVALIGVAFLFVFKERSVDMVVAIWQQPVVKTAVTTVGSAVMAALGDAYLSGKPISESLHAAGAAALASLFGLWLRRPTDHGQVAVAVVAGSASEPKP